MGIREVAAMTPCKIHPLLVNPVAVIGLIAVGFGWGWVIGNAVDRYIRALFYRWAARRREATKQ